MSNVDLGVMGHKRSSFNDYNPRAIIAKIMQQFPTAGLQEVQKLFREKLHAHEDFEDYLRTLEDWFSANTFEALTREKNASPGPGRPPKQEQTLTPVAELDKSGFIKSLYGK